MEASYSSAACPRASAVASDSFGRSSASSPPGPPPQLVRRGEAQQSHPLPSVVAMARGGCEGPGVDKGSKSAGRSPGLGLGSERDEAAANTHPVVAAQRGLALPSPP